MPSKQKSPQHEVRRPVWAEVSLGALTYNLEAIRKYVNPTNEKRKTPRKILSIVKGNAYGHGGPQVARALEKAGSDWLDRKSTRLNSSHLGISYAVFCLKKKRKILY